MRPLNGAAASRTVIKGVELIAVAVATKLNGERSVWWNASLFIKKCQSNVHIDLTLYDSRRFMFLGEVVM